MTRTKTRTEQPYLCEIRSRHSHEFMGIHADVTHLQGNPDLQPEYDVPEPDTRPCPACGATLTPEDTHWSLFPSPMGGYVCPVPPSKGA